MGYALEQVKTAATVPAVLSLYGYDPRGQRRIPCPIHGGRNPNFSFNDHEWYCFRCNRGGDVIRFVQDMFGLSFPDALSKLAADFGIEETREEGHTDAAAKAYAEALKRFNERLALEEEAERKERRRELAERSKLHAVLFRQLLRWRDEIKLDPNNAELARNIADLAAYLHELEFELDFRIQWESGRVRPK
jgi:DNA primase